MLADKVAWSERALRGWVEAACNPPVIAAKSGGRDLAERTASHLAERLALLFPEHRALLMGIHWLLEGSTLRAQASLGPSPAAQRLSEGVAVNRTPLLIARELLEQCLPRTEPSPVAPTGLDPDAKPSKAVIAEWTRLSAALAPTVTAGVASLADADERLVALGYVRGEEGWSRGGFEVRTRCFPLADREAFELLLGERGAGGAAALSMRAIHLGALVFNHQDWELFENGYRQTLDRYQKSISSRSGSEMEAKDLARIRRLVSIGRPSEDLPLKRVRLRELNDRVVELKAKVRQLKASGSAPKGVLIFVEGIDAASKTSNGMKVKDIFESAGYQGDWLSFRAPSAEDRARPSWLDRYRDHTPGENAVFLCDRSPLGDYAYHPAATPADLARMGSELVSWQDEMEANGILVLKYLFYPGLEASPGPVLARPMYTFGKREARAAIARDLLTRERAKGVLEASLKDLESASIGPGYNDLKSFHEGEQVQARFGAIAAASAGSHPWVLVRTPERHPGRVQVLSELQHRVDGFAAADG